MVQWNDATEIAKESRTSLIFSLFHIAEFCLRCVEIFTKLIFALFGLYLWEIFQTSDFEWSIITGKRKFGWPLVCCKLLLPVLAVLTICVHFSEYVLSNFTRKPAAYTSQSFSSCADTVWALHSSDCE